MYDLVYGFVASNISQKIIADAMKETVKEDKASTLISSVLRGHKGRMKHNYIEDYSKVAENAIMKYKSLDPKSKLQNILFWIFQKKTK